MATRQLRRDPFARATLVRLTLNSGDRKYLTGDSCAWCGGAARYKYQWVPDSVNGQTSWMQDHKAFCSVGCFETYTS
jgi:hypothetical protein